MGSSPYSPVVPLVICLPLRPLTGALMARRRSEAFWLWIGLLPAAQIAHPTAPSSLSIFLPPRHCGQAVSGCATPDLGEIHARFSWKEVGTLVISHGH